MERGAARKILTKDSEEVRGVEKKKQPNIKRAKF